MRIGYGALDNRYVCDGHLQKPHSETMKTPVLIVSLLLALPIAANGQARGGRGAQPVSAKASAPIDLTGYWVAEITEDWRWRMVTPAKVITRVFLLLLRLKK